MQCRPKWSRMKPEQEALLRCCGVTFLQDRCIRSATVTREGQKYCKVHDPLEVQARKKTNKDYRHKEPHGKSA